MSHRHTFVVVVALALGAAVPAAAQTPAAGGPRLIFGGGASWHSAAPESTASFEFSAPSEPGRLDTVFTPKSSFGLDLTLATRVSGPFGIGVGMSLYAPGQDDEAGGTLTAHIPHPFVTGMSRVVSLPAELRRKEFAIHANALYFIDPSDRLMFIVGGGVSVFRASQTLVEDIEYHEETPATPTVAVVTGVDRFSASGTGLGFNGSVEAIWSLQQNVGVAAMARYTRGTVTLEANGREAETPTGGLHLGLGIRFHY